MLTRRGLARRKLLESASAAILFYPLLKMLNESEALAQTTATKRFLVTYFPSGVYQERWRVGGWDKNGDIGDMNYISAPLNDLKKDMVYFTGLCFRGGRDHNGAMTQVLAGSGKKGNDATNKDQEENIYSLDQRIADRIGGDSAKKSINLSINNPDYRLPFKEPLSWSNGSKPNVPSYNPKDAFTDIFGNFQAPGGTTTQKAAVTNVSLGRKSIMDFLKTDLQRINANLSGDDKAAFAAHVDALAEIERDINKSLVTSTNSPTSSGPIISNTCGPKAALESKFNGKNGEWFLDNDNRDNIALVFELQREIIRQAFACNITKVAVWQIGASHTDGKLPTRGVDPGNDSHHFAAHSNTDTYANLNRGHIQEIANLVKSFKETAMGDHSLFDEVLTLGATCIGGQPSGHGKDNVPCFLIGNAGGQIKTGRVIKYDYQDYGGDGQGKTYNHLLVSVANLMGLTDVKTIGNTSAVGPLPELMKG